MLAAAALVVPGGEFRRRGPESSESAPARDAAEGGRAVVDQVRRDIGS